MSKLSKKNVRKAKASAVHDGDDKAQELKKCKRLWQPGDLFHVTRRYPRKKNVPRVDRLAGILKRGLVAPGRCPDGLVHSDLNLVVSGCSVPYDTLIFLHRYGPVSYIYTIYEPGRFTVFVDPALPVLTEEDMGPNWAVLSQDEVYVRDGVAVEKLTGIAVYPDDGPAVLEEFLDDFQRLGIPLYTYDGTVLWPS
jgi:hypothetical protein